MIEVENLIFDYPGIRALDNITFSIKPGSITALVGPNGSRDKGSGCSHPRPLGEDRGEDPAVLALSSPL